RYDQTLERLINRAEQPCLTSPSTLQSTSKCSYCRIARMQRYWLIRYFWTSSIALLRESASASSRSAVNRRFISVHLPLYTASDKALLLVSSAPAAVKIALRR